MKVARQVCEMASGETKPTVGQFESSRNSANDVRARHKRSGKMMRRVRPTIQKIRIFQPTSRLHRRLGPPSSSPRTRKGTNSILCSACDTESPLVLPLLDMTAQNLCKHYRMGRLKRDATRVQSGSVTVFRNKQFGRNFPFRETAWRLIPICAWKR